MMLAVVILAGGSLAATSVEAQTLVNPLGSSTAAPMSKTATGAAAPTWSESARRKESQRHGLVRDNAIKPNMQIADFDGDGQCDVAWQMRHRATQTRGVLIVHASGRAAQLFGAGVVFGKGGDDFSWMDTWQVIPRRSGKGEAPLVAKAESASAIIEFRSGRYRWQQAGD